jgi:predicted PurR-regulated permease PerM
VAKPTDSYDQAKSLILWTIAVLVVTAVVLWAAYLARGVLLLIYISALLAIGFSPMVRLLERQRLLRAEKRRVPRWAAILTLYLVIVGAIAGVVAAVLPPLTAQTRDLWKALPELFEKVQSWLLRVGILDRPLTLRDVVERAPGSGTADAAGAVAAALFGVVGGAFGLLTILILTFYFLIDAESLFEAFLRLFPRDRRRRIADASRQITVKVSAWLMGQLLLATIIGITAAIGLGLMRVPYFYVLALIAGIGEMIPIVGPVLAAVPAVLVALAVSPQLALAVGIFFIAQQQFENHVLVPKVMERQVGLSAVFVIVALLIGGSLLGIMGAILAVPTAAILQVMLQELVGPDEP